MNKIPAVTPDEPKTDTFYNRHPRFFTVLGALIIFATFIVKEHISERLRDLVTSIGDAQNLFVLREDTAFTLNNLTPSDVIAPIVEPQSRGEQVSYINAFVRQGGAFTTISLNLSNGLPEHYEDAEAKANTLYKEMGEILDVEARLKGQKSPEAQLDADTNTLYERARHLYVWTLEFKDEVLAHAKFVKQKREHDYEVAKRWSYVLFSLGWLLAFYGQLSDPKAHKSEQG